jgi:tetratricopeptide (TPR) repeat protein
MRIVSTLALAITLGGLAAPAFAKDKDAAPKAGSMQLTPAVRTALLAAQTALEKGDNATVQTQIAAAKPALATPDDKYMTGSIELRLAQKTNDPATENDALDLMISSGKAAPDLLPKLLERQGSLAFNAKDYRKAAASLQAARAAGLADPQIVPFEVEAMANAGDNLKALTTLNAELDKMSAAGQTAPSDWYARGMSFGYHAKINPADQAAVNAAELELAKRWIAAYPTRTNWHDVLVIYSDIDKLQSDQQVDLLRLQRATGSLVGANEYRELAEDVYVRFPGEAQAVLQEGASKGVLSIGGKNDETDVMNIVKTKVPADKASLPASDKAARAAANGHAALSTADAYTGYGQYAQAVDLYKVALAKGGVDPAMTNLHLGWALAQSGDTAGAKQAFAAVTGPRKTTADFWVVHLDHPTQPDAPKAAATK